jgi:HlyD family secretion protein
MKSSIRTNTARSSSRTRRGGSAFIVMVGLVAVALCALLVYWFVLKPGPDSGPKLLVSTVSLEPYDFTVIEQGEVESASNVELRCEVKSRTAGGSGITIIEVIPEGTQVEPGDLLVKLDSSALEQERISQQIVVNTSESLVVQSQNTLDAAKIARIEYLEGTFKQEEKLILGEVFVAEQNLRTGQLSFESAQRLAAKNIVTSLQLEGSQFAVDKARNELESAQTKLMVIRKYTREKMLKQFDSDIATATAKLHADESVHAIELNKLKDIDDQIAKCIIKAPMAGQVVYANKYGGGRSGTNAEFVVEAGAVVREQQPIIRLPDRNNMQVKALINEARVTLVRPGQPVTIRVDALKDNLIQGEVVKVNQYAEPGGWSSGNIKKYAAFVKIVNAPPELRTGMNTEARIHVERIPEALQVPVQALAEHRGKFFVLVQSAGGLETREVTISSTNDTTAVVKSGLGENDRVVMNPRSQPSLALPDVPEPSVQVAEVKRPEAEIATLRPAVANNLAATVPGGPAAPGGAPGGSGGEPRRGPPANMTPASMIARSLEQYDSDKDGKLSSTEIGAMDERFRDRYATADKNSDGFVDRAEMMPIATAAVQRIKEMQSQGGSFGGGQ